MPSPAPGSRTWPGCAAASSTMSSPPSTRCASASTLLRVGRPGGLGLLEMLERFLLEPVGERLVAGVELLASLAEIFSLGLRLLVLGEELLLDLGRGGGGPVRAASGDRVQQSFPTRGPAVAVAASAAAPRSRPAACTAPECGIRTRSGGGSCPGRRGAGARRAPRRARPRRCG